MANRFICEPKKKFHSEDFAVILIHSELKKGNPHGLVPNKGEPLIHSQLRAIKNAFGDFVDLLVVNGYKSNELERELNRQVRIIINENYEITDIAHSIYLGLKATTAKAVYLIDGSLEFNEKIFIPKGETHVYVDNEGDTGLILEGNRVVNMSYGVDGPRLGKIIYLANQDVIRFNRFYDQNLLLYEIFNLMIENNSVIYAV